MVCSVNIRQIHT